MIAQYTVPGLILLPLLMAMLLGALPLKNEKVTARLVMVANVLNVILTIILVAVFIASGFKSVELSYGNLLSLGDYHFKIHLLIDKYSIAFQALIGVLTALVLMFSRRYMHREQGYRRFFASLFLFVSGISLVALAATIDMLFAGWEIVGISSFLLIGFYRMRLQPGRNSLRAYAIYRFCDVGLFLEAWFFHKLGAEFFFLKYADQPLDAGFVQANEWFFLASGLLIVLAAMGKSAQYPFSFWVPRAMEGPTPSSAIFYGALSIHAGVYLLIRLYPIWHSLAAMPWLVGSIGFITAVTATIAQKTQSNIKGQIGYASVAQVGIMFCEMALGLKDVAMLHFLGNAALRCYQLLASPSVMVLYLRQQAEGAVLNTGFSRLNMRFFPESFRRRYFAFSFSEGYAEALVAGLWEALKKVARIISPAFSSIFFIYLLLMLLLLVSFGRPYFGEYLYPVCSVILGVSALFVAVAAVGVGTNPGKVLWMLGLSAGFKGLSAVYLNPEAAEYSLIYFIGIMGGFIMASVALRRIPEDIRRTEYAGAAITHPKATNLFFLGALWMSGFTLSPTFFGEDILLHFGAEKFAYETFFIGTAFVLNAVTLMRTYVKLAFAR